MWPQAGPHTIAQNNEGRPGKRYLGNSGQQYLGALENDTSGDLTSGTCGGGAGNRDFNNPGKRYLLGGLENNTGWTLDNHT